MKNTDILFLNAEHQRIVDSHIRIVKRLMYYATEDVDIGKYQDFLEVLNSIYMYSNSFYSTMLDKSDTDDGVVSEYMFIIPNMSFYTAIGFLAALKNEKNSFNIKAILEKIGTASENAISELADVLIDEKEKKELIKDIASIRIKQNNIK